MIRKIFSFVIVLSFLTVQAQASVQEGLKLAFDEMNYALSVEWDQKDQAFYKAEVNKFNEQIAQLQNAGLSNAELINFAKTQIKDKRVAKDVETALTMVSINQFTPEEASQYVMEMVTKSYSTGASWNGRTYAWFAASIILFATIALVITDAGSPSKSATCTNGCYLYTYNCAPLTSQQIIMCTAFACDGTGQCK